MNQSQAKTSAPPHFCYPQQLIQVQQNQKQHHDQLLNHGYDHLVKHYVRISSHGFSMVVT